MSYVVSFEQLRMTDVDSVGGKNCIARRDDQPAGRGRRAGAGRLCHHGPRLSRFPAATGLDQRIAERLTRARFGRRTCAGRGRRGNPPWIVDTPFPAELEAGIRWHLRNSTADGKGSFAVRSSATAEDLPDASFAGQQETFLNVVGIDNVLDRMKHVFASLYNDRAISYRVHKGFAHAEVALSAGVQRMVRSRPRRGRRDVHASTPNPASRTWCSSPPATAWARRWCRAPSIRTSSTCTSRCSKQGKCPIIRRNLGSKLIKMEFTSEAKAGQARCKTVDVPLEQRNRYSLTDDEVDRAGALRASSSRSTTAARWTSSGARTAATASSTSCRRVPRR